MCRRRGRLGGSRDRTLGGQTRDVGDAGLTPVYGWRPEISKETVSSFRSVRFLGSLSGPGK